MVTQLTGYNTQRYTLNSLDDLDGIDFHNGDQVLLMDLDKLLIFDEENSAWYDVPAGGGGGGGSVPQWTLIDQKTIALEEFTSTTAEAIDTGIDISQTDYACILVVVTCDTPILTSLEWGMTIGLIGRYSTSGNTNAGGVWYERGCATLSTAALVNNAGMGNAYGVYFQSNKATIVLQRLCSTLYCPKIRAGNYTVKVYGLTAL